MVSKMWCDRCGREIKDEEVSGTWIEANNDLEDMFPVEEPRWDLCEACSKEAKKVLAAHVRSGIRIQQSFMRCRKDANQMLAAWVKKKPPHRRA